MKRSKWQLKRQMFAHKMESKKWFRRRNKKSLHWPQIKQIYPRLFAQNIVSVQPLTQTAYFELINARKADLARIARFGAIYPSWTERLAFDGKEFIPLDKFISWYGKDKLQKTRFEIYRELRGII